MKRFRTILLIAATLLALAALGTLCLYVASQATPEFYVAALPLEPDKADEWGKQLERSVLNLQNELQQDTRWQLNLQDEQINGWLTSDLPKKFPEALPPDILQPRVVFHEGQILVACRLKTVVMTTVLSLVLEPYLTDDANQIAIRIRRLRAGRVPLPMKGTLERVATAALRAGISLRWSHDEGDPVAVIRLPHALGKPPRRVEVESLSVQQGRLSVRGRLVDGLEGGR